MPKVPAATKKKNPTTRRPSPSPSPAPAATVAGRDAGGAEKRRFWLTYPTRLITKPVIWEMSRKFPVVFNVRQASVTEEMGILCLELEGPRADLKGVIAWLEKQGVKVEPVEINVIES